MGDTGMTGRRGRETLPPRNWDHAARALRHDGVVFLPGALGSAELHALEGAFAASVADPSPKAVRFYPQEDATFFEDTGQRLLPVVRETGIDATVAALWGEADMWYLGEQLFLKEGGHSRRTRWHQDTSYLRMMGTQLVACWISLDPLPKAHCLEFVRGSHKGTLYNGSAFAADDDTAPLYKQSLLPRLPDIQNRRDDFDIVSWDVAPGDMIVFHLGILHGGAGTVPGMRRRTLSLRFLGPDVAFDGRPRDEVGAQEGNDAALATIYAGLKHGDPFHRALGAKI
ncbi:MAG: phytanoyl-CoA dioxygenase family protein [Alphaproteobacteria bacterium]|nr:phytanoyl-CoA dioxygenase family protein [Alphaproteobacteria bacterium]